VFTKQHIIDQLRKEIIEVHGVGNTVTNASINSLLGPIINAFPNTQFPLAAIHEFILEPAEIASTTGFMSALLAALMQTGGNVVWLSRSPTVFPPALSSFGLQTGNIIFIYLSSEKQITWATEEALKCGGLCAVVAEINDLSFTSSRRLQLAVEKSKVTGFIIRNNVRSLNTTACASRFKINSLPSSLPFQMPGVGYPHWQVQLLKVRNGHTGKWDVEFSSGRLRFISKHLTVAMQQKRKAV